MPHAESVTAGTPLRHEHFAGSRTPAPLRNRLIDQESLKKLLASLISCIAAQTIATEHAYIGRMPGREVRELAKSAIQTTTIAPMMDMIHPEP